MDENTFALSDILRSIASRLETPVIFILIAMTIFAVFLLGWLFGEFLTERRHLKVKLPKLLDELRAGERPIEEILADSGLLGRQKMALLELTRHPDFTPVMREALAIRLIEQEQGRYDKAVKISDLTARLGPMFGLLGTLIPLGPGIIALGQGDTYTLSVSMLTAFDTTITGLIVAAAAMVVSAVRRSWYRDYMSLLDVAANCVLECVKGPKV